MGSEIIIKERARQREILIGCPNMCKAHKHEHLEHKRVLINLKEYMGQLIEWHESVVSRGLSLQIQEDIKELTKMIEAYSK